ncbi:hypothetical protein DV453_002403 [Geotrichum candidum]|nr:hypothetical protein DV453_002403 [Geotrichum candidum]
MQAGFSSMNDLTVLQASQGLAKYVAKTVANAEARGIVIGHDHRYNSKRFAELTALAFSHAGFKVYLYGRLVHTPLVPFGVDELGAACGVMITASHNPAQDNGYKVYWGNGCQIIPPHDFGIAAEILADLVPWTSDTSLIKTEADIVDDLETKYFAKIASKIGSTISAAENSGVKFVYTAMHGVGLAPFLKTVDLLGLRDSVVIVEEQAHPDPDFPTVSFPNPEEKGALDLAKSTADKHGITIVLANDPDADRFAVAVKNIKTNAWVQITGNQLGALFAENAVNNYEAAGGDFSKLALLNSTVSSQLIASMANVRGFHYEDTLTGFKWIGNRAIDLEKEGFNVPFAFEEAIGYMFPIVHDKDGISAATVFLRWAATTKNFAPLDELEKIYQKYGYFEESNSYYISRDSTVTNEIFESIRAYNGATDYPRTIGRFTVTYWRDLTKGYDSSTADHVPTLPVSASSQMITAKIQGSSESEVVRFTARGSGTEPKLKVYIEARGDSAEGASKLAQEVWDLLAQEWFHRLI